MGNAQPLANIHIVGLGVAEETQLSPAAYSALMASDLVIGSKRQLDIIKPLLTKREISPTLQLLPKLAELKKLITSAADKKVVVIASGDPLFYGIGRWFANHFALEELCYYPAISSIQAACHAVGLSMQDVEVLSLHGRPVEKIRSKLRKNQTLVILTDKKSTPHVLAAECAAAGFEQSTLWVCENLGYTQQQIRAFSVEELLNKKDLSFDPLHVTIIKTSGRGGVLPEFPGIPDHHFVTGAEPGKGMISKREVRMAILSFMQPGNEDVIWDIGAGCGGVAVELAYWNERATVYAVECHQERLRYLHQNQQRFGVVQNLKIIEGRAPEALHNLPKPNKVFIGGSDGTLKTLLTDLWQMLPVDGVLVASGVVEATKNQLQDFAETLNEQQVESTELAVKRGSLMNQKLDYVAKLPVAIFKFTKTGLSA
ncbi:precorrin-6y C5,15-methyltransferase (decarboxylating) subunit CbiE [Alkalimarinus alittae]|uniref:Precorrin-6y C5,15-methyltransferase (Decarboxylating) subunit CbiE n=1 Tax=Alkalimarinus alittae TaxID=2961619 RepID=A0ABY6N644_9ALTE|nr:precorrin-6y C5,15-methyltransferase (decarboxylating) subunit CbiE [Alkalimarinus alittae]UZE97485.1 precorrin-6y C5,15-methyltransferase (decarboxylating) subunit CbiE [Alkalimarinus alittae]